MILLVDCDDVLSDFATRFREYVKWAHGVDFTYADVQDYQYHTVPGFDPSWWDLCKFPGFAGGMEPLPGAVEAVKKLRILAEVFCVTSPYHDSHWWMDERLRWLEERLGFDYQHVIFTHRKDMIRGDILLEDRWDNAATFPGKGVLFDRPWNQPPTYTKDLPRVYSWDNVIDLCS